MEEKFDRKHEHISRKDEYRIERWYEWIEPYTFTTHVLPLPYEEAEVLKEYRELSKMIMVSHDIQAVEGGSKADAHTGIESWNSSSYKNADEAIRHNSVWFDEKQKEILQSLTNRLDAAIQPFVQSSGGAFVKLSTRSPKDAALVGTKMQDIIEAGIKASTLKHDSPEALIEDIVLFTRAGSLALKVTSGMEAIELLVRSQRTYEDISLLELIGGRDNFDMQLIVREWCEELLPEWEFRAFVHNKEMTAMTHYYPFTYVPEIHEKKKEIEVRLLEFWASIKDRILLEDYTVDFAISPDLSKIWIVEINNPPPVAGVALFDWDSAADRKIIKEGPFEFRVLSAMPAQNPLNRIHQPLRVFIDGLRGRFSSTVGTIPHTKVSCDVCHRLPISVKWYRCRRCPNFDVCAGCYASNASGVRQEHESHMGGGDAGGWLAMLSSTVPPGYTGEEDVDSVSETQDDGGSAKQQRCTLM
eukprot:TRINITY_DN8860_c0_g1_i3.p1 TRINITY_DN8860_c0_g1~~TRINITY_DN8860_c0_g1_i3.p1  ORF type:complete len:471 (+),score=65.27 TRINITY_DN8860_c0_g1_i3:52-1464(+)